jgi:hypothetical protein
VFWHQCTMLQVILTPTCRVSGYPRRIIKVATLLRQLRFIWTALPTLITLNNYTTRHLQHFELVYLPSRRCDPTSPPLFSDVRCLLESSDWTASLDCFFHWTSCFRLLLSAFHWLLSSYNFELTATVPLLVQRVNCSVERFPRATVCYIRYLGNEPPTCF